MGGPGERARDRDGIVGGRTGAALSSRVAVHVQPRPLWPRTAALRVRSC